MTKAKAELENARNEWKNGVRNIVFKPYHYTCPDGCCDDYGTDVYINGFHVSRQNDVDFVVELLMEFLNIDNVKIDYDFSGENDWEDD
jgi:hypothetical protein